MLEFYSSSTSVVNSRKAMAECLEKAFSENDTDCDLIIFYSAIGHNFKDLLGEARRLSPHAQIVGCTCAGVIGREGANESMKALGIMAIRGKKEEFAVSWIDKIQGMNSYDAAAALAQDLKQKNDRITMIHFLASGIDIAADRAIEGIESIFGKDMPIFGATSSDNMKAVNSFQFAGDTIFEQGSVAIGFADPSLEIITQATHGFEVIGLPVTVTRSTTNRVYELDNVPAWEYLTQNLGLPITAPFNETIPVSALAELLPEQHQTAYNNSHILRVIAKKEPDGSMYMPVACPEGTKLWLTKRNEDLIFGGLDTMVSEIVAECDNQKPLAVFHADCCARGRHLFNSILKDEIVMRMQSPLCDDTTPWLGMYGLGEFAQINGKNFFHNYTTALYVIFRRQ